VREEGNCAGCRKKREGVGELWTAGDQQTRDVVPHMGLNKKELWEKGGLYRGAMKKGIGINSGLGRAV